MDIPKVLIDGKKIPLCQVVKIKRSKGEVVQDCDIYVGRQCNMGGWRLAKSKWHNPFKVTKDNPIEDVCNQYYSYLVKNKELMNDLEELRGKVLGCWCVTKHRPINERLNHPLCHGEVLMGILYDQTVGNRTGMIMVFEN